MQFYELFVCLFLLRLSMPVNNFSVMSGGSHRFLGFNQYSRELMYLAQGHNTELPVGYWTLNTGPLYSVRCSTVLLINCL